MTALFLAISLGAETYALDVLSGEADQYLNDSLPFATMAGALASVAAISSWDTPPDLDLDSSARAELVLPEGFLLEEHTVQTPDGYLLSVYRIPAGLAANSKLQQAE